MVHRHKDDLNHEIGEFMAEYESFHADGTHRCAVSGGVVYRGCIRCQKCRRVWWWGNITIVEEGSNRHCLCEECLAMIDLERLRNQVMSAEEASHAAGEVERLQSAAPLNKLASDLKALTDEEREVVSELSGYYLHEIGEPF